MKTGDRQPMRSALQLWLSRDKLFPQDTFCTLSLGSGRKLALTPSKACLRGMSRSVSAVRGHLPRDDRRRQSGLIKRCASAASSRGQPLGRPSTRSPMMLC
jgi:hypothetical protein